MTISIMLFLPLSVKVRNDVQNQFCNTPQKVFILLQYTQNNIEEDLVRDGEN